MKDVLISINPPYTEMILRGEKWLEFRHQILNVIKNNEKTRLYLYETKNKGGKGMVVGEAVVTAVYGLHYDNQPADWSRLIPQRSAALKQLYYDWCDKHALKANPNEGWFSSKKFTDYTDKIGWGGNYALYLEHVIPYAEPKPVSAFMGAKGNRVMHPPQNMCYCVP